MKPCRCLLWACCLLRFQFYVQHGNGCSLPLSRQSQRMVSAGAKLCRVRAPALHRRQYYICTEKFTFSIQGLWSLIGSTKCLKLVQIRQVADISCSVCYLLSQFPLVEYNLFCNYGQCRFSICQVLPTLCKTFQPLYHKNRLLCENVWSRIGWSRNYETS